MANDFAYIIKAIDQFTAPTNGIIQSLNKLNRQVRTGNRLMMHQNDVMRKMAHGMNNANNGIKKADESANLFGLSLGRIATAGALYKGWEFSKELFRVQSEMQGLNATFAAVMPKFYESGDASKLAANEIAFLKKTTDELGVSFEGAVRPYSKFLAASNMGIISTRETFKAFAGFGRLFNLSSDEFGGIIKALEQMQSKGTIMSEELRLQLGDRMPGVLKLFADAAGVSTAEFMKMMEQGKVGANLMSKVGQQIQKDYGDKIAQASKSMGAEAARASNEYLYMKMVLSDKLTPAMNAFIQTSKDSAKGMGDLFIAMNNKDAFNNMSDGMKTIITTLKVAGGLAEGFFKALSGIKQLGGLAVDVIGMPLKAGKSIGKKIGDIGLDKEAERYKETIENLRQQSLSRKAVRDQALLMDRKSSPDSKANVTIDFKNVPKGASILMEKDPASTLLNLGGNISYGGSY